MAASDRCGRGAFAISPSWLSKGVEEAKEDRLAQNRVLRQHATQLIWIRGVDKHGTCQVGLGRARRGHAIRAGHGQGDGLKDVE